MDQHVTNIRDRVTEAEWQTRVDLAACYRLVALYGMTDLIYNHITARVPGAEDEILINPFGLFYDEITASSLIKIDHGGNILMQPDPQYGINHAGYVIHSAVHAARHDVACVLHTHTKAGVAVSVMKDGLLPLTQAAMRFHDRISYHDFEGPAVEPAERERLVADLGNTDAMILRNHGLLTCGRSIPEAFLLMNRLDNACKCQVEILSLNAELTWPSAEVIEKSARVLGGPKTVRSNENEGKLGDWNGQREWAALLRKLDKIDPSYRD